MNMEGTGGAEDKGKEKEEQRSVGSRVDAAKL